MLPPNLVFVLVEPARPENVGAAARAIKTMGFNELRIVGGCDLAPEAYWLAHQSQEILDQARRFPSLDAALQDVDFSIATGARRRRVRDRYLSPEESITQLAAKAGHVQRAAFVFGRESSGLTGEEIARCDACSTVPMVATQPSLNLAQAVMLYAWELRRAGLAQGDGAACASPTTFRTVSRQSHALIERLGFAAEENIHDWLDEQLAVADDRSLGLLMSIIQRLEQRLR